MQDTFLYRISATRHALGLALCAVLALVVAYFAAINKEGLNGFKAMSFSPSQASMIFWGVAAFFALGALCCTIMLRRSLEGPVSLKLGAFTLSAPRATISGAIRGTMLSIPYVDIRKVTLHSVQTQQMLVVDSSLGQARVSSLGFTSELEFEMFYKGLTARVGTSQRTVTA
jgi:hypothetical protein